MTSESLARQGGAYPVAANPRINHIVNPMNDMVPTLPVTTVLDVTGLKCPLPLLKTKVELNRIQSGQILRVLATDPMAVVDLRAFCVRSGHEMLSWEERGRVWEFFIRKAASDS